jgi:hypothetical protein
MSTGSFRRRLWNAPVSAAFWCFGIGAVVVSASFELPSVILKVISIILGSALVIFGAALFVTNRHHSPGALSDYHPAPPTDRDGSTS